METVKFKNGVTLIMEKFYNIRSVAMGVFVKNGSLNELPEENGISHFIEHMLFKGTENRSAADIAVEMDSAGGDLNAYTTKEYTCYYTRVPDNYFERSLDILADMYFNPAFSADEIEKERGVIDEEIDMYEDSPDDLVHEKLQNAVWRGTSLGRPVLGTHKTIAQFDRDILKNYMKNNYCSDNTVISVAGNIDYEYTAKTVEKYFGNFTEKRKRLPEKNDNIYTPSVVSCRKEIEQQHICLGFRSIPYTRDERYIVSVMNTIIGGGMSSLLFQNIREKRGLAYSIYSYTESYADSALFCVYSGCNKDSTETVKNAVLDELYGFAEKFDDEEKLKNAKQQRINGFLMGLENTSGVMTSLGRAMLLRGCVIGNEQAVEEIEKINIDMLRSAAGRIFIKGTESISVVGMI